MLPFRLKLKVEAMKMANGTYSVVFSVDDLVDMEQCRFAAEVVSAMLIIGKQTLIDDGAAEEINEKDERLH